MCLFSVTRDMTALTKLSIPPVEDTRYYSRYLSFFEGVKHVTV